MFRLLYVIVNQYAVYSCSCLHLFIFVRNQMNVVMPLYTSGDRLNRYEMEDQGEKMNKIVEIGADSSNVFDGETSNVVDALDSDLWQGKYHFFIFRNIFYFSYILNYLQTIRT